MQAFIFENQDTLIHQALKWSFEHTMTLKISHFWQYDNYQANWMICFTWRQWAVSANLTLGTVGSTKAQEEESQQRQIGWAGMGLRILQREARVGLKTTPSTHWLEAEKSESRLVYLFGRERKRAQEMSCCIIFLVANKYFYQYTSLIL